MNSELFLLSRKYKELRLTLFLDCSTTMMTAMSPSETSGTSRSTTERHIPEDLHLCSNVVPVSCLALVYVKSVTLITDKHDQAKVSKINFFYLLLLFVCDIYIYRI